MRQSESFERRAQQSVSTLTDQALIAFEIEHERNRLKEELNRLQKAQDDTQRSIQILDFMASNVDGDPLLNPKLNTFFTVNTNNANSNGSLHQNNHNNNNNNNNNNNGHIQLQENDSSHSSQSYHSDDEDTISPNLEYLPSNTVIRLSNKQMKKICNLQIGDKILSLCINLYPNGKSRNSYLPKPNNTNLTALTKKQHKAKSKSGLPKRPRSRTTANIKPTFMLPPPQNPVSNDNNEASNNSNNNQQQQQHGLPRSRTLHNPHRNGYNHTLNENEYEQLSLNHHTKQDSLPRKSMPFLPITEQANHSHQSHVNGLPIKRKTSNHDRAYSFSTSLKNLWMEEQDTMQNGHHSPNGHHNGYNHNHNHNGYNVRPQLMKSNHGNHGSQSHQYRHRGPSQPPPYNKSISQSHNNRLSHNNYLNGHHHHQMYSRSTNNSPRISDRKLNRTNSFHHNKSQNNVHRHRHNHDQKRNSIHAKDHTNYLESVIITNIFETKVYEFIEIITTNAFRICCTPTHLFWICGKGWGCFDAKTRMSLEKHVMKYNKPKKVTIPHLIHELRIGQKLLTITGKKFEILKIRQIEKSKPINVYSIIVNKNNSFFANDLLVKNSMY